MTVVEGWFTGTQCAEVPEAGGVPEEARLEILANIALNSKVGGRAGPAGVGAAGRAARVAVLQLRRGPAPYRATLPCCPDPGSQHTPGPGPGSCLTPSTHTCCLPQSLSHSLLLQAFLVDHEDGEVEFVGNRTECALLVLARKWGQDYKAIREDQHANLQGA
jgi:hypothetical protein